MSQPPPPPYEQNQPYGQPPQGQPGQPYGQPAHGQQQPYGSHPVGQTGRKGKPWLLIAGLLSLLVSLALCGLGGFRAFDDIRGLSEEPYRSGAHTVTLAEGETTSVWGDQGTTTTCGATGPSGAVDDSGTGTQEVAYGERSLQRVMSITAEQAGDYTISCDQQFVVGNAVGTGGIVLTGLSGLLCCIGLPLAIIGLILWLRRRSR